MPRTTTFAISIDKWDYRETSQIVRFLTEGAGVVAALARGAFREKNSYQGPIDLLVYSRVTITRGDRETGLDLLTRCEVLTHFPEVRHDLRRYRAAMHLLRVVRETVREGQHLAGLFPLFRAALVALNDRPAAELAPIVFAFEWRLLRILGIGPCLTPCAACGTPMRPIPGASKGSPARGKCAGAEVFLSPADGGLVCLTCAPGRRAVLPVSSAGHRALRRLERATATEMAREPSLRSAFPELRRLLDAYFTYHLERPFEAAAWLDEIVSPGGRPAS
ncbi:MAG: DNA repair protein RecO [Planctomycetota bacterium]